MKPLIVTIPVTDDAGRKRFPRVGAMFENRNRETGEVFYTIRLDYPVAVTELLVFPPRPAEAGAAVVEEVANEDGSDTGPGASDSAPTSVAASGKR